MAKIVNLGGYLYFTHKPVLVPYVWKLTYGKDSSRLLANLEDGFSSGVSEDDFGIVGKELANNSCITGALSPRLNKFAIRCESPTPSRPTVNQWDKPWAYFYSHKTRIYWFYRHPEASKMLYVE